MKVHSKLERCQTRLKWWSKEKFGQNENLVKEKTELLTKLQSLEGPNHHARALTIMPLSNVFKRR